MMSCKPIDFRFYSCILNYVFCVFAHYSGFSEAEVRYKYADFKQPKVMDWRKREKKKKAALKLQEKKIEQATKGN